MVPPRSRPPRQPHRRPLISGRPARLAPERPAGIRAKTPRLVLPLPPQNTAFTGISARRPYRRTGSSRQNPGLRRLLRRSGCHRGLLLPVRWYTGSRRCPGCLGALATETGRLRSGRNRRPRRNQPRGPDCPRVVEICARYAPFPTKIHDSTPTLAAESAIRCLHLKSPDFRTAITLLLAGSTPMAGYFTNSVLQRASGQTTRHRARPATSAVALEPAGSGQQRRSWAVGGTAMQGSGGSGEAVPEPDDAALEDFGG